VCPWPTFSVVLGGRSRSNCTTFRLRYPETGILFVLLRLAFLNSSTYPLPCSFEQLLPGPVIHRPFPYGHGAKIMDTVKRGIGESGKETEERREAIGKRKLKADSRQLKTKEGGKNRDFGAPFLRVCAGRIIGNDSADAHLISTISASLCLSHDHLITLLAPFLTKACCCKKRSFDNLSSIMTPPAESSSVLSSDQNFFFKKSLL